MSHAMLSRRRFVGLGLGTIAASKTLLLPANLLRAQSKTVAPSDRVRFAVIGTGVRGCNLLTASLLVPGAECVAVSDLYDSRHQAAKEALKRDVPAGRSYKEILDRKDVDAVLIAVADHQHRRIVEDALAAGKDVYCEKPMSHTVEDGFAMVDAVSRSGRVMQVGSQRVSSVLFAKAKEIYDSGVLGEVYSIEASLGRNSASGAWVYPIPPDASAETIDWAAFLGDAPKRPFDAIRFFRWRCFQDYGEGLAGDLFVHLISGAMFVSGTSSPPLRGQSSGGIFRWKDGREYPDVIETLYDYPKFSMTVRCTLNNDSGDLTVFYGTNGTMVIHDSTLTVTPQPAGPQPENYSTQGWPAELRSQYLAQWYKDHAAKTALQANVERGTESFTTPKGYDDTADHQARFFESVRSRKPPVENEVFGNHAAIACHLSNYSYFHKTPAVFDSAGRTIKG
jgi:predicted dehydrogenase